MTIGVVFIIVIDIDSFRVVKSAFTIYILLSYLRIPLVRIGIVFIVVSSDWILLSDDRIVLLNICFIAVGL
jgi:hypothetical protein